MMEFSWAISQVKWLSSEKTAQPFDLADSPRELHHRSKNACGSCF